MKEIILIIIFILIVLNVRETFDENLYYNDFRNFKFSPLTDNITGKNITFSRNRSIKLFNYLLNFNFDSPINKVNENDTINMYLSNFDSSNDLINLILENLNLFLNKKHNYNFNISKDSKVLDYVKKVNNFNRTKFINMIGNNNIKENNYTNSFFLIDEVFNLLTSNNNDLIELKNLSFKDSIINYLSNKRLIELNSINDYDSMDVFLNGVGNYIKSHVNEIFNKNYDNILDLKMGEVRNIYFSGEKNDFSFN